MQSRLELHHRASLQIPNDCQPREGWILGGSYSLPKHGIKVFFPQTIKPEVGCNCCMTLPKTPHKNVTPHIKKELYNSLKARGCLLDEFEVL